MTSLSIALAILLRSYPLLLAGTILFGCGQGPSMMHRAAAADLYPNDVAEVRKALQAVELDQAGFCSNQAPRIPQSLDLEGW